MFQHWTTGRRTRNGRRRRHLLTSGAQPRDADHSRPAQGEHCVLCKFLSRLQFRRASPLWIHCEQRNSAPVVCLVSGYNHCYIAIVITKSAQKLGHFRFEIFLLIWVILITTRGFPVFRFLENSVAGRICGNLMRLAMAYGKMSEYERNKAPAG